MVRAAKTSADSSAQPRRERKANESRFQLTQILTLFSTCCRNDKATQEAACCIAFAPATTFAADFTPTLVSESILEQLVASSASSASASASTPSSAASVEPLQVEFNSFLYLSPSRLAIYCRPTTMLRPATDERKRGRDGRWSRRRRRRRWRKVIIVHSELNSQAT